MDLEKFKRMRENYKKEVGKGEPARNREGSKITEQTQSVWFDRATVEELLAKTDKKTGGLKIYFGEYGNDTTLDEVSSSLRKSTDLVGRLTVILGASNANEDPKEGSMLRNGGSICPPNCGSGGGGKGII